MTKYLPGLFVAFLVMLTPQFTFAMIEGSEGNEKINDARMPKGATEIINSRGRIAWWEGDGGPFHADGRGDTKAMKTIVANLAKLDVKTKRIVIHDGIGQSYLLNMDMQSGISDAAKIDWTFSVWPKGKWENTFWRFTRPNQASPEKPDLPAQIDVYTANIRWSEVAVPLGIDVIDERLEAHGFTAADGNVIEGRIKEMSGGRPMVAKVRVQRIERNKDEGSAYTVIAETKSTEDGTWVLKNLPEAWVQIVVEADGFVPRVVGHARCYDQPQWRSFESGLSRAVSISGRVKDESGVPVPDVEVRLVDVNAEPGGDYDSPSEFKFKTDAEGRFRSDQVPTGKATAWLHKAGFSMGGLGQSVTLPSKELELQLLKAGSIRITVDFNGKKRPNEYMVELEPEGGNAVGTYGGAGKIDAKDEYTFENVPPGKYVVKGHPNPRREDQTTEPIKIDLERVDAAHVTIKAK